MSTSTKSALRVLKWFMAQGAKGGTADECESSLGGRHQRINDLVRAGYLAETKERRLTKAGRPATVYVYQAADTGKVYKPSASEKDARIMAAAKAYIRTRATVRTDDGVKTAIIKLLRALDTTTWSP
jgi:hypothetical protein